MTELLEMVMLVCFGISWPMNVVKSYKARSTQGKSLTFLLMIIVGYIAGITSKLMNPAFMDALGEKWFVLFIYFLNLLMVLLDLVLYFRNLHLMHKSTPLKKALC
ncbi:MAG: hypothetical protein IKV74_04400 [Clostridia bacterium]|nr:hypothetical protein [Clostridia bacterium]